MYIHCYVIVIDSAYNPLSLNSIWLVYSQYFTPMEELENDVISDVIYQQVL